jgi:hypothetical protein
MNTIPQLSVLASLPVAELNDSLRAFLEPVTSLLPDARLKAVAELLVAGVVSSQSPVVTQIARGVSHAEATIWPTCQRGYRFLANERFTHWALQKGLYRTGQVTVAEQRPAYLVIAVDPVNFEKPYTEKLEGVSTVVKSRPPSLTGEKRKTRGYPAITATVVNLKHPAVSYAQWFSYWEASFLSQNREVERALRMSRAVFPREKLRFVGDAGLDDQKVFAQVERVRGEFVIRACHDRNVEVWNARLQRWEPEKLFDLTASVPFVFEQDAVFTHARRVRRARLRVGWLQVRLLESQQVLWVVVVHDPSDEHDLILLTNVALTSADVVRQVYADWRQRGQIEHTYRFDQEDGLDVEDLRVQTLERMRRVFLLVLLAAQFVATLARTWSPSAVRWLRQLGGKLGLAQDRDGLYVLLRGMSAVWQTAATLAFLANHPFPRVSQRCV